MAKESVMYALLEEKVPNDWVRSIIVGLPIYEGKGDRSEC